MSLFIVLVRGPYLGASCHKLATRHRILVPGRFLYCCDEHGHDAVSLCLLSKASLLYSIICIQCISTNNPLARKQAGFITNLHNNRELILCLAAKHPIYYVFRSLSQSLIISKSALEEDESTSLSPTPPLY